jgi:NAD(P)-dependent dehydrogenase (short-subunit alcohol dehydrogenase family)
VSNASYLNTLSPIASFEVDDWFKSFEVMVKGNLIVAQAFLKRQTEKDAAFISVSSNAA